MDVKKPRDYKKATMAAILVTIAALAVTVGAQAMRQERVVPTQGTPHENNSSYYTPNPSASQESSGAYAMASHVAVYTVRTYEGRIGIFLNDSKVPFEELDVDVGLLPEADQVLLEEGIRVTDREHLNRLIEDYES